MPTVATCGVSPEPPRRGMALALRPALWGANTMIATTSHCTTTAGHPPRLDRDPDQSPWAIIWMPDHREGDDRRQSCLELARAIARGRAFAPLARISVAVLEQDRPWWAAPTQQLAREN